MGSQRLMIKAGEVLVEGGALLIFIGLAWRISNSRFAMDPDEAVRKHIRQRQRISRRYLTIGAPMLMLGVILILLSLVV
jgi:hypothetical protein